MTDSTDSAERLDLSSGVEALQTSPEFQGAVEPLDGHSCTDHFALIYEDRAEQLDAIVPFMRQGLARDERCMYVVDELTERTVVEAMERAGVDVQAARESGQLSFHTVGETYLRDGAFDPDEMVEFYADAVAAATEEYAGLRVAAETTWLQRTDTSVAAFMEYESKVNRLFAEADCIALCTYDRTAFEPTVVRDIIRTHPHLIYDGTVCHNVYYTPPAEFLGPDSADRDVERMMATLVDRTEAKTALRERERHQRELYEITASPDLDFEEKLQRVFDLGCSVFDLELGGVAQVDQAADSLTVEWVGGEEVSVDAGTELPLSETFCGAVADGGEVMSVSDANAEGYGALAVHRDLGFETYLGTNLELDAGPDRTFFFLSCERREEPITAAERAFHDLMGQWVQYELDRRARERALRELYEIVADSDQPFDAKLDRVLDLGRERFGLGYGYLSRYDAGTGTFEIEHVAGEDEDTLETGVPDAQPRPNQFCRQTVVKDGPLGAPDVRTLGWEDDPVYAESGLSSYFGVKVTDGTGVYGTLVFADTTVRDRSYTAAEDTFLELMGQWVSHELTRRRRETQLAALNEMSRVLMNAEAPADIAEATVDHARRSLDLPLAAVLTYDRDTGELTPAAATPRAEDGLPCSLLRDTTTGPLWETFVTDEVTTLKPDTDSRYPDSDVTELVAFPLARQGVLVTATTAAGGFGSVERDFLETVAATVEAACTRADRERLLHERETALEEQNSTLERLNRINTTIRNIDKGLVQAGTQADIERVVCEQLADVGPYELAWVGEHDPVTDEITPRERAGDETGYLDDRTVTADGTPEGRNPAGLAVETHETHVVNNILEDRSFAPWRQAALNRGYHACIALPLVYEDSLYGVLKVYAGQPDVFDDLERAVLSELSDTIAHAINAVESKKALVADEVTQLEFDVDDDALEVYRLAREVGCTITMDSLVAQSGTGLRGFYTVRGAPADDIQAFESRLPVADLTLVTECTEGDEPVCYFETTLEGDSLAETVLDHGGTLQDLAVSPEGATVTVDLAADAAVRSFVEMFRTRYPDATLTAQRTRQRDTQSTREFQSAVVDALTARQLEVLQTTYFSGYFEEPRTQTASEIADRLDITQPTLNSHLRAAQRKLHAQLFEDGDAGVTAGLDPACLD